MLNIKKIDGEALFEVTFSATAAEGMSVCVAGSFNDWDPAFTPMEYDTLNNLYRAEVYLKAGEYEYKFVVDGEWLLDEANPSFYPNDFGTLNSVLVVPEDGSR